MHSRNVALVGVNSRIGPAILDALLSASHTYQIYLFLRPSSKPPPVESPRITRITLPDPASVSDLITALSEYSIEYVVSALSPAQLELQKRLADACVSPKVDVRRYVLADYGSCRSDDPYILDLLPNFRKKREVREHCIRLVEDEDEDEDQAQEEAEGNGNANAKAKRDRANFSWTSLFTGHFFDYGLSTELLGFDIPARTGVLFDQGTDHWSATTTGQIGRAVVAVFDHMEETANRVLLVQSFRPTQVQVLDTINQVLRDAGKEQVKVDKVSSKQFVKDRIEGAAKGEFEATEEMVAVLGIKRSDWKGDKDSANHTLHLKEENIREVITKGLKDIGAI